MAANTKLILLQDVEDLGRAGDTVNVAAGFARNFLLPKGLAAKATPGVMRRLAAHIGQIEAKRQADLDAAQALAGKLAGLEVTLPMQAGDDGRLFGSVNAHLVADKLAEMGFTVEPRRVRIKETIKEVGTYEVELHLHTEVNTTIKVWVVKA